MEQETVVTPAPVAAAPLAGTPHVAVPVARYDRMGHRVLDGEATETPLEALASACTVVVIALFVFTFIAQNFVIPSGSMLNTLLIGDHVLVDRITLAPATAWAPFVHYRPVQRKDVVVFLKPNPEQPDLVLVKRVVGVPGDRIHLQHGVVYLNGVAQNEPNAIQPDSGDPITAYDPARDDFPSLGAPPSSYTTEVWTQELKSNVQSGDIVVPANEYFAMGDNRTQSADSRYWGFLPRKNVMGRPVLNYWSFKTPESQENKTAVGDQVSWTWHVFTHFLTDTRWSRTLHVIR